MGALQLDCSTNERVEDRVKRALALIDEVAAHHDVLVLPELWNVGAFDLEASRAHAQALDGPLPTALSDKAREHELWLHGGSFCEVTSDGHLHNTSVLFDPHGDLAAYYRKIHVFTYGGEHQTMTPGHSLVMVETPLGLTGLATCYDLRFPEQFRAMAEAGAESFLVASGWPSVRIPHWDALVVARAIENQAWVVACNEVGDQHGLSLGGHSTIVDPQGVVQARGGETEECISHSCDRELGRQWRSDFPALDDIVSFH